MGQVPLTILALLLVVWKFNKNIGLPDDEAVKVNGEVVSKIGRIDFIGATLLSTATVSFLFAVDFLAEHESGQTVKLLVVASAFLTLIVTFFTVEAKYIREPIFPPKLILRRDVATTYLTNIFQSAAQMAVSEKHTYRRINAQLIHFLDYVFGTSILPSYSGSFEFSCWLSSDSCFCRQYIWIFDGWMVH